MRALFRTAKNETIWDNLMKLVSVPLNLLRDYTIPCGEEEGWDRNREAVVSMTIIFAFLWLNGNMQNDDPNESQFKNIYFLIGIIALVSMCRRGWSTWTARFLASRLRSGGSTI